MAESSIQLTDREIKVNVALADADDVASAMQRAGIDAEPDEATVAGALTYVAENVDPDEIDVALYEIALPLLDEWARGRNR